MPGIAAPSEEEQLWLFEPALKIDMARLKQYRDSLQAKQQAHNTRVNYAADWRDFIGWCRLADRSPLPATAETLELYATHRLQVEGKRTSTVERHLSAIGDAHRRAKMPMPATLGVRAILSGARHARKEAPDRKAAITPDELRRISRRLARSGDPRDLRDRALIVLGFASGLRRSNLAALAVTDVRIVSRGVLVTVRSSKTDQSGEGVLLGVHRGKNPESCPARVLRDWLRVRGALAGPLFPQLSQPASVERRLSGKAVASIVKRAVELIGLDPAHYSGHTLRASCVTAAHVQGASDSAIMARTGHKKAATLQRYIRNAQPFGSVNPLGSAL